MELLSTTLLAQEDRPFLGDNLLAWLLLAFGAAMVFGNTLAWFRPPKPKPGEAPRPVGERPPLGRTVFFVAVGLVAAIWAAATLLS